jgi:hypothetical protein
MAVGKQRAHEGQEFPGKGHAWRPTYELCRMLPDGSWHVIRLYFTLEEAETRAKALQELSMKEYRVYDQLTQKFVVSEPEANPRETPRTEISCSRSAGQSLRPQSQT